MKREKFVELLKWAEERSGIKMTTPEYEVMTILFDVEHATPLEMRRQFSGSDASFFNMLKSLESKKVIVSKANPSDRRSKLYTLSARTLKILSGQWNRYQEAGFEELYKAGDPGVAINTYTGTVTQKIGVRQFTCEYQILVYLHASPGLTNIKFQDLIDVSETKFNKTLASLQKSGHIFFERDPSDGRAKLYYLSNRVKNLFLEMDERIAAWMESRPGYVARL